MFVPRLYQTQSAAQARTLMRRHPIAILTTNGDGAPWATHLPIVAAPGTVGCEADTLGDMIGDLYWGHLNKANPHWTSLVEGQLAKLMFSGPGSYVSPGLYDPAPAAPTWDFAAVHVEGVLRLVTEEEGRLEIVSRTAALLEGEFGMQWEVDGSYDYFTSIVDGVGGFTITLTKVDVMMKLSQERSVEERERIAARIEQQGDQAELGGLIRCCNSGSAAAG